MQYIAFAIYRDTKRSTLDVSAGFDSVPTVLQGLTQPKVSGYNNVSISTLLRYSYATFGLCAEIVDAPSYTVLALAWGLNYFNWQYARFGILSL